LSTLSILLAAERFPPDFAGGGELLVWKTAAGLRAAGARVQVVTTGNPAVREFEQIPTERVACHRYAFNLRVPRLARWARRVDLIQTFNYHAALPALLAARHEAKPVVCTMMALFGKEWRSLRPPGAAFAWEKWERFLVRRRYDRTLFLSESSQQLGLRLGANAERSRVIAPGLDLAEYEPAAEKEQVIFFSGKLEARKGIYDLLAIAARQPDLRFEVMGWGPEEDAVRRAAPGNVRLLPFERGAPLRRRFGNASIFFFPSRAETFGFVLLEAMASGCAVVSSVDLPFAGQRVEPGNLDQMERALLDLWRDPARTAALGRRNYELARPFTWEWYTVQLLQIYGELLPDHAGLQAYLRTRPSPGPATLE